MAIVSPYATPSGFKLNTDGRTYTAYSGEVAGAAPNVTAVTMIDIAGTSIDKDLFVRINMGAIWPSIGAEAGFVVYYDNITIYKNIITVAINGGTKMDIELILPRDTDFKIDTINDASSGLINRYIICTAWALAPSPLPKYKAF